jgi:hypothetical protein
LERVDPGRHFIVSCFDFGEEGAHVLVIEWESACEECVEDDAAALYVGCVSPILLAVDDFWGGVVG